MAGLPLPPNRPRGCHYCLVCQHFDCRQNGTEHRLTQREFSALALVGQGMTNKAIAWRLKLTEGSVRIYLSRLYRKLPLADNDTRIRSAAIFWWLQRPELHGIANV